MMKKMMGWLLLGMITTGAFAQQNNNNQKADGRKILDKLCGCFEVGFKYAETFSPKADYKFHDREVIEGATELALPIKVTDSNMVIQHLLIVGKNMIVKHWREEWSYQNPIIWKYTAYKTWVKDSLPAAEVKGKWTQSVWEVADEPRYQGYSTFVHLDNKLIWQNTTDAPLPRREYSKRDDYNILQRTNRLNITDSGYYHEQENKKIIRTNGVDELLVEEKGLNTYKKIDEWKCAAAKEYWTKHAAFWGKVRNAWANYISKHNRIELKNKVNDMFLHEYLISLSRDYLNKKLSEEAIDKKITDDLNLFILPG